MILKGGVILNNFDYKVLKFLSDSENTVTPFDVSSKFGASGSAALQSFRRDRLIFLSYSDSDPFLPDNHGSIRLTDHGHLELERYRCDRQLRSGEIWRERIFGVIFGVLSTVAAEFIIRYLSNLR